MNWNRLGYLVAGTLLAAGLPAQIWTGSGSDRTDGKLEFAIRPGDPPQTFVFDPVPSKLDMNGDNVYHFSTIDIGPGVTLRLLANKMRVNGPVVWLATGAVNIQGTLDASGENGHAGGPISQESERRRMSIPGPGGFPGGFGGGTSHWPASPGLGPGGGSTSNFGCPAGHVFSGSDGCHSSFIGIAYGSSLIQPLVGGSGGGGGRFSDGIPVPPPCVGRGGGAGGGAIRITSSDLIAVTGSIRVDGGQDGSIHAGMCGNPGGHGSGGAIHLQAPTLNVSNLLARGQNQPFGSGASSPGRIRLDYSISMTGTNIEPPPVRGPFINVPTPGINNVPGFPNVRLTAIDGIAVPSRPTGEYFLPDVVINKTTEVTLAIAATNIPVGTTLKLYITAAPTITDQERTSTALAGTLASSTATATATLPQGVSRFVLRAVW